MKKSLPFIFLPLGMVAAILFLGNAGGAALVQKTDRTGSPLSPGPCQVCHNSGKFNTTVEVQLVDEDQPVTIYTPGKVYTLKVMVHANNQAQHFGFQTVALAGAGNSQAGTFQNPQNGVAIRTVNNRTYPEHQYPNLQDTFRVEWVAPTAGTGDVHVYAAGVATNANNNDNGDGAAWTSLTLQEAGVSAIQEEAFPVGILNHFPGRSIDLSFPGGSGWLRLIDLNGVVRSGFRVDRSQPVHVPLGDLASGVYILAWTNGVATWAEKIVVP